MSPLLSLFERIYVINLAERTDRRRRVLSELAHIGVSLEPHRVEIFPAIRPADAGGFANIGVRGCFLSHRTILETALADRLENVLVMEDDLMFAPSFNRQICSTLEALRRSNWQIAYLGHNESVSGSDVLLEVPLTQGIICAHFYAMHRTVLPDLVAFLQDVTRRPEGSPDGGPMDVDGAFSFYRARHPDVHTFLSVPSLGRQGSSRSDLSPAWHDRVTLLRPLVSLARSTRIMLTRYRS